AEPLTRLVVPLVLEAHRHAALVEGPERLRQPIVEFPLPFSGQKVLDLVAAAQELPAVAPDRVDGIGQGDTKRITRVPGGLGGTHLGQCSFQPEGWSNGSGHRGSSLCHFLSYVPLSVSLESRLIAPWLGELRDSTVGPRPSARATGPAPGRATRCP